ncbi:MAG TPA: glycosyltransferase [Phycisphaerae bacterium]|nr:glycosyltransferase [Phycisphaerae bacterium]
MPTTTCPSSPPLAPQHPPRSTPFPDLLFLSLEPWDDIWRRNQFLTATLAKRHPHAKFLFVNPARDLSNALRRRDFSTLNPDPLISSPPGMEGGNIFLTRPTKLLPNSLAPARRFNEALLRRHVRKAARALGLQNPLLWLNPHSAVHMVGRMHESAALYDITDDWTTFTQPPRHTALIRRQDAALCQKADAVIVCSQKLLDLKRPLIGQRPAGSENLYLIPNGVDADHYAKIGDPSFPAAPAAAHWPKPVFGYTGTIHPDRVDLALLSHLAASLQKGSLVLVGPNHLPPDALARFAAHKNVFFTGPVPYAQIPAYMQAFDVCITPHRMTPFTESLNPIKLWEYLAAGKPIVSTDVAGFRDYPQHVSIASTPEDFTRALHAALAEDPAKPRARRAEARRHSWESRVEQVESVIASVMHARERTAVHAG